MDFVIGDYHYYTDYYSEPLPEGCVRVAAENRSRSTYPSIPSSVTYNGITYNVVSMRDCFQNCINLQAPVYNLPSTITDMQSCYSGCRSLSTNNLLYSSPFPGSVENLDYCFKGCTGLHLDISSLAIPNTVTSMEECFKDCSGIYVAPSSIPNSVTNMTACFEGCKLLETPPSSLPSTLNATGYARCYSGCERLETTPSIPSGVTTLYNTFKDCKAMTNPPVIPNGVTHMGGTFYNCTSLVTAPDIPASVSATMQYCFASCSSLQGNIRVYNTPPLEYGIFPRNHPIVIILAGDASAFNWRWIADQQDNLYLAYDNSAPALQLSAIRCNSSGVEDEDGQYAKLTATVTLYEDNVPAGTNAIDAIAFTIDGTADTGAWTDSASGLVHTLMRIVSLGDLLGHVFSMSVTDEYAHTSGTITVTLPNVTPALDFIHGTTDNGAAFGKVATQAGVVDSAWPISSDGEVSATDTNDVVHNLTEKGPAITSYELRYQSSSSGTTIPTGTWQATVPSVSAGYYLWTRMVYTYSDGSSYTAYAVARNGSNGSTPTTYIIEPSCSQVIHDGSAFNPTSITFYSYYYGAYSYSRTAYSRYWVVEYSTDGSTWNAVSATTSSSTSYTLTLSNVSSSAKFIRVRTRSSSSGGTYYATYILPVIFSTTGVTGVKGAYESSYRTGNVNLTLNNLAFLGVNPTGGTSNDTCTWWRNKGTGYAWISATGQLNGQPAQYGFLINIVYGSECHQEFWVQPDGPHFKRGGNGSTEAMPSWSLDFTGKTLIGGYYGIEVPENSGGKYVRAPEAGIIPYTSGGSGYLGTSGWPWAAGYFNALYVNGNSIAPSFGSGNSEIVFTIANSGGTERLALVYDGSNNRLVVDLYKNGSWKGRKTMAQW